MGWGFHTLPSGIYPEDHRFRPLVVGVVDEWKDFGLMDGTSSSPGVGGPRRWPEGKLS